MPASKKDLSLVDFDMVDISEDLAANSNLLTDEPTEGLLFNKYSASSAEQLMAEAGIISALQQRGYSNYHIELQSLSSLDQRIFVKAKKEVIVHLRLKLAHFRFRLHQNLSHKRLLYVDWLETRDPRKKKSKGDQLFPGQDAPGLGIFTQLSLFITALTKGLSAVGAFNMPEYFHDALLFHRHFFFYDPSREAVFRALIRDLRSHGARAISRALGDGHVRDVDGKPIGWQTGEMLSILDESLARLVWTKHFKKKVDKEMRRLRFKI